VHVGAALHSVRAVPADQMGTVVEWARAHHAPLHAHVSEQPAENEDCARVYGATPVEHLAAHGFFDSPATAVHATHLTENDQRILGTNAAFACFCVTTERDLADGIGPAAELAGRGVRLALGSDSHAVIDLLEEARGLELDERLASRSRGHFRAAELLAAATVNGAASLGWDDLGTLTVGSLADFCTIRLDSVRTAGVAAGSVLETALFAGSAADIATVVVGGRTIVEDGRHVLLPDVAGELQRSIDAVTAR
jgi:formiminoglutamate deiminase